MKKMKNYKKKYSKNKNKSKSELIKIYLGFVL